MGYARNELHSGPLILPLLLSLPLQLFGHCVDMDSDRAELILAAGRHSLVQISRRHDREAANRLLENRISGRVRTKKMTTKLIKKEASGNKGIK